jgi:hypothetical protein
MKNNLINIDNIKSEPFFYVYKFENTYHTRSYPVFPKKISYYMNEIYNLENMFLMRNELSINDLIFDINNYDIPEKFKFQIKHITKAHERTLIKNCNRFHYYKFMNVKFGSKKIIDKMKKMYGENYMRYVKDKNYCLKIELYKIFFVPNLISLLSQLKIEDEKIFNRKTIYVKFLGELIKKEGVDFDKYISNWVIKLLYQNQK